MTEERSAPEVVLASASRPRANLLQAANVPVSFEAATIDEASVKSSLRATGASAATVAETLAEMKAKQVSPKYPGALIIGADQMLECGQNWFDKPADLSHARAQLLALRGKTHELIASVCVVRDSETIWRHTEHAKMTMRKFSNSFLDNYIQIVGKRACEGVGAYQLENFGSQLFSAIDGDYFTIMGMPLLPLLEFLRGHEVIME